MARKKKEKEEPGMAAWLVTFSDLVTLLLTFFVLLLSMASMDKVMLARINPFQADHNTISLKGAGKVPTRIRMVMELINDTRNVFEKQNRIKDLLFPDDELPPDIDVSTLDRNLRILEKPEGLAIVLTDELVFEPGSYTLTEGAKVLLEQVALMLRYTAADCNISGHTDTIPGGRMDNYTLSGMRAQSVLEFFINREFAPERFSISAYGPDKPLEDNRTEEGRRMNRRVEILLKTEMWLGRYA